MIIHAFFDTKQKLQKGKKKEKENQCVRVSNVKALPSFAYWKNCPNL